MTIFDRNAMNAACEAAWNEAWAQIEAARKKAWAEYYEATAAAHLKFYGPDPADATNKYPAGEEGEI